MPPLDTTLFVLASVIVIFFIRALAEFQNELPLPFMADVSHGLCPQCGSSCADFGETGVIDCKCGCFLEVHPEDED